MDDYKKTSLVLYFFLVAILILVGWSLGTGRLAAIIVSILLGASIIFAIISAVKNQDNLR